MAGAQNAARRLYGGAPWFFILGAADAVHVRGIRILVATAPLVACALWWSRSAWRTARPGTRAWADGAAVVATASVAVLADNAGVTGFGLLALLALLGGRAATRSAGVPATARRTR